jgi:chaperonin GroES
MSNVAIKPLDDRVLIEPMEAEEKTASGLYIPDTAKEKPQKGKVIAVGTGTKDVTMSVKSGDTVLYGKYAGTEITFQGKDYLIMRQSDILAVI